MTQLLIFKNPTSELSHSRKCCFKNPAPVYSTQFGYKEHKLKVRDLFTVINYRNEIRDEQFSEMLLMSITTTHSKYLTLGIAKFAEISMRNSFDSKERMFWNNKKQCYDSFISKVKILSNNAKIL